MEVATTAYLQEIERLLILAQKNSAAVVRKGGPEIDFDFSRPDANDALIVREAYAATLSILSDLYGSKSPQVTAFSDQQKLIVRKKYTTEIQEVRELIIGTLTATKHHIEAGLIKGIISRATGTIIGDLITTAKNALKDGQKDVASVLAAASFEDMIKRMGEEIGITTENKKLPDLINALKANGLFAGAQGTLATAYVKLRNSAMHADWKNIQESDVNSLISFVEPLLIKHFS